MEPDEFRFLSLKSLIVTAATVFGIVVCLGFAASPAHKARPQPPGGNAYNWPAGG